MKSKYCMLCYDIKVMLKNILFNKLFKKYYYVYQKPFEPIFVWFIIKKNFPNVIKKSFIESERFNFNMLNEKFLIEILNFQSMKSSEKTIR